MFRSSTSAATDPFAAIASVIQAEMQAISEDVREDLAQAIDIPVGHDPLVRSAPGEPPRKDSWDLRGSLEGYTESTDGGLKVTAGVDTNIEYAPFLENGTPRMAARPAWLPTYEKWCPIVLARVADAMNRIK